MRTGQINVQTENIFPIIKKFLYSDHEIFLRELVSNAVDASQKIKVLEDLNCSTYFWLNRNIKKGEILLVFEGMTYNCISRNGIAVTELTDTSVYFEVPKSKIEFLYNDY